VKYRGIALYNLGIDDYVSFWDDLMSHPFLRIKWNA
jgi:hypothetical protein